jgi:S1-C subfamily serine protease
MQNIINQNKKIKGFLFFTIFVLIILSMGAVFGSGKRDIFGSLSLGGLNPFVRNQPYSPNLVTQQVVQEESQVINVVDKVSPAVVSIVVKTTNFDYFNGPSTDESGIGTGFIVDKSGLIVTDSHVVDNENGQYSVVLKDGSTYDVNKINLDRQNDLAILEITARDLPTVALGDSDKLKVGQRAIAIGNALGQFQNTVTVGVVSGIGRSITAGGGLGTAEKSYESVIQTDAAINPGNSGGPLLNIVGQVIGISVATSRGADNISFAIPVNTLKPILESFLKEGRIIKPYLGVSYQMIGKELAQMRRLPEGAFVLNVSKDTPADKAGLQRSDIITKFDGNDLTVKYPLAKAISVKQVGDEVSLEIDRNGKIQELKVVLAEMPQNL